MARSWSAFPPIIPGFPPGIIEHASEIRNLTSQMNSPIEHHSHDHPVHAKSYSSPVADSYYSTIIDGLRAISESPNIPIGNSPSHSSHKPECAAAAKRTGAERFEEIEDKSQRKRSQSKQIKQIKIDLIRLLLTTGAHSALLIVPQSWNVHKFATAGDFSSFLEVYAAAMQAQQNRSRRQVKIDISEVWERFQGQGGLHQIESLCSVLLKEGCDEEAVEEAKDIYLASLVSSRADETRRSLARFLNGALRAFKVEMERETAHSAKSDRSAGGNEATAMESAENESDCD
jgi:hypothetical protein